jgi:XTP/dITP diphosphohydrolase
MSLGRELLVATRSPHKLRELRELIKPSGFQLVSLDEAGVPEDPIEEHLEVYDTFEENARAKAVYFQRSTLMPTIADDSGLCVDRLDGGPGVRTKRFAPDNMVERYGRDAANNRFLLQRLKGVPEEERGARYRCAIAYEDGEASFVVEGAVAGRIATEPSGEGGFGYDPLFVVPEYGKTFGVLPPEVKAELSHRSRAARALAARLRELRSS